jgi:hypothetical protein
MSTLKKLKCVLQQQMLPFPFLSFASFLACVGGFRQSKLAMLASTNSIQPRRRFFRVLQLR